MLQFSKLMSRDMGLRWAIVVFANSAIHQGSIRRLLGPFLLRIPRNRFCHGHHAASDRGCTAHISNRQVKTNSSPCATLRVSQALGGDPTTPTNGPTRCH